MWQRALSASGGGSSEKVKVGEFKSPASGISSVIDCGFTPKKIIIWSLGSGGTATLSNGAICIVYDEDLFGASNFREYMRSNNVDYASGDTIPPQYWGNGFYDVQQNGFRVRTSGMDPNFNNITWYFIAIG